MACITSLLCSYDCRQGLKNTCLNSEQTPAAHCNVALDMTLHRNGGHQAELTSGESRVVRNHLWLSCYEDRLVSTRDLMTARSVSRRLYFAGSVAVNKPRG